ncbi:MAG TPA: cytochrome c3 family protein, partial [Verrucomicrobiae bacterium]|nr:cytochrome c3 family protein [Verrucomicrobiae bacterium]
MGFIWNRGNRNITIFVAFVLALLMLFIQTHLVQATNKITNGSFNGNISGWTSNSAPTPQYDTIGLTGTIINAGQSKTAVGGSLRMGVTGVRQTGTGYMSQTVTTTETNPTVKLSFAWKKNYVAPAPSTHEARVRIVRQSDAVTNDAWIESTVSNANTWNKVEDLDLSGFMASPGTYEIQLYTNLRSGNQSSSSATVWFDEVYLDVSTAVDSTSPTFSLSYYSDTNLTAPLPVDNNGNPVTKAGTVFIKVTASEPLQSAPTLTINAPGTANDRSNVLTTAVLDSTVYKYQWDVIKDSDGSTSVSVSGTDVAGNNGTTITSGSTIAIDSTANAPSLDSAVPSTNQVDLAWSTAQTDIDHYEVHRSTTNGFTPAAGTLVNGSVTGTTYPDGGLSQGTTYYYKIIAIDKAGNISLPSNQLSAQTLVDSTPPVFTVTYYSDSAMTVPLSTDNTGKPMTKAQTVYIKAVSSEVLKSGSYPVLNIAAPGTVNDKTNQNMVLVSGNTYTYSWVVAAGTSNDGNASISISGSDAANNSGAYSGTVIINTQITTPGTPTASAGPGYVGLTWSTPDVDIVNFKVYRSLTSGFTPDDATNLLVSLGNVTAYTDTACTYPNTYYYKIIAIDVVGNISTASAQVSGTPQKVNPHGNYSTNTAMCSQCHTSHESQGGGLVKTADATSACYLCHDAGGQSSYNVASEFGKVSPFNTSHHPVPEGNQKCTDCHNPHNNSAADIRLLQTGNGAASGNNFCWSCHGTGSTLPAPNGDHQTNYPALGTGHNNNTWTAPNGKTPFSPDFDTTAPGSPQIGCEGCHEPHGSNLVKLLRVADWNNDTQTPQSATVTATNNKDLCFECHNNSGRADGVAEADNAWLGSTAYGDAMGQHNGTTGSCTSKCHQPHGSTFPARYLGPNETGFDYLKFAYDQNYSSTRTTAYANADFQVCTECHDLTKLVDSNLGTPPPTSFADKTRNLNLHKVHLIDAGTNGKGNAVCKECHDPHGTTTAWNSSGEHLVAFPATTVAKNTLTSPKFTDNQLAGPGKGSCDLVCHGVSHKDKGVAPAVNATYSGEAASSGEGGPCTSCHADLVSGMASNSTSYTHPIPSDADDPNGTTANCDTYCHAPHNDFKDPANPGGRAANLRTTGGPSGTIVTTNKDFDA